MAPTRYESKSANTSTLGQPLHFDFANRSAPNRFMKAAMTERLSSWSPDELPKRGIPSENLINVYRRWGQGKWGVILSGNLMIDAAQLEAAGNPIVPRTAPFSGERFEAFQKLAAAAKAEGSVFIAQVSHPGRQCPSTIQKDPVSASDIHLEGVVMGMSFNKPHAASETEIKNIVDGFAYCAEYLEKAGFDGIQLHAAHGYLLAQFLAQSTNKRKDSYGGSLANRARIVVEIAEAVRARVKPSFILAIKLNSVEFQEGGLKAEEARELCNIMEANKFDFVELSGGTYEELAFSHKRESTKKREAFFLDFADAIVPDLKHTKAYVTGGLRTSGAMVDALKTVHGIGLARPACQEPHLPLDILSGKVDACIKQLFGEQDFGLTNVVAGSQIRQLGLDREPFDGSDQKSKEAFEKDMQQWADGMSKDTKMEKYGYVDTNNLPAVPYGTAAVS